MTATTLQPIIPRTDTPALLAALQKSGSWDEHISMAISNPNASIVTTPTFKYDITVGAKATRVLIFDHLGAEEDMERDLKAFLAGLEKGTKVALDESAAFPHARAEILERVGFTNRVFAHPNVARQLDLVDVDGTPVAPTSIPPPEGITIHEITSSTDPRFDARVAVERDIFGYGAGYFSHLPAALAEMMDKYGDYHLLATTANQDGGEEAVGYMTLRVHRGVAYLQGAGTVETWRKRGLTKAMLARTVAKAVEWGFEVMLTVAWDENAVRAWTAMGFREVGITRVWDLDV
ncbi:uncharacterized protein EV422DRAFT_518541 [Fimicolochytrium jonesii]|uniref:uncharacterized protein n=1 Tax=Fimicolochytrium jonesii TaxID=1396493 RepID=UPI0022FDBB7C|nr:uncharacterized protein EV422DRAFT_518541 [Fimicolochytrium jonesii]KAI8823991.1 hypothetical protein EV422DRAFT_518541 [Fimicolochytrium jonesii]